MEDLKYIIHSLLRNGDVFSIWNENQIVFILFNIEDKNIHLVEERIIKEFDLLKDEPPINLKINIKPILEE